MKRNSLSCPAIASAFPRKFFQLSSITYGRLRSLRRWFKCDAKDLNTVHILQVFIPSSLFTVYSMHVILVDHSQLTNVLKFHPSLTKWNQPSWIDRVMTTNKHVLPKLCVLLKWCKLGGGPSSDKPLKGKECQGAQLCKWYRWWCTISIPLMHSLNDSTQY
jgi:hypothetical protein